MHNESNSSNTTLPVKILLFKHNHSCNHLGTVSILTKLSAALILWEDFVVLFLGREHKPQNVRMTVLLVKKLSSLMPSMRKASKRVEYKNRT